MIAVEKDIEQEMKMNRVKISPTTKIIFTNNIIKRLKNRGMETYKYERYLAYLKSK